MGRGEANLDSFQSPLGLAWEVGLGMRIRGEGVRRGSSGVGSERGENEGKDREGGRGLVECN